MGRKKKWKNSVSIPKLLTFLIPKNKIDSKTKSKKRLNYFFRLKISYFSKKFSRKWRENSHTIFRFIRIFLIVHNNKTKQNIKYENHCVGCLLVFSPQKLISFIFLFLFCCFVRHILSTHRINIFPVLTFIIFGKMAKKWNEINNVRTQS